MPVGIGSALAGGLLSRFFFLRRPILSLLAYLSIIPGRYAALCFMRSTKKPRTLLLPSRSSEQTSTSSRRATASAPPRVSQLQPRKAAVFVIRADMMTDNAPFFYIGGPGQGSRTLLFPVTLMGRACSNQIRQICRASSPLRISCQAATQASPTRCHFGSSTPQLAPWFEWMGSAQTATA